MQQQMNHKKHYTEHKKTYERIHIAWSHSNGISQNTLLWEKIRAVVNRAEEGNNW